MLLPGLLFALTAQPLPAETPALARIAFTQQPPTPDVTLTLPGQDTPCLRLLCPEWITADGADLFGAAKAVHPWAGPFHCMPGDWQAGERGSWTGVQTVPGVLESRVELEPEASGMTIRWEIRNLGEQPLANLRGDFCLGVNAGGGGWANRDFLLHSRLDRAEDGRYWRDQVAPTGAWVHLDGQ